MTKSAFIVSGLIIIFHFFSFYIFITILYLLYKLGIKGKLGIFLHDTI